MTLKQHFGKWLFAHLPCSRRTFDILRYEFRFARQRWLNAWLPWRHIHIGRLRSRRCLLLNVGSGGRGRAGWINLDASPNHADQYCTHDLRRPLLLDEWFADPSRAREARVAARRLSKHYCWDVEQAKFLEVICKGLRQDSREPRQRISYE